MAGKIVRHYVDSTNQGDDLLWGYIRQQITSKDDFPHPYRCHAEIDIHAFGKESFLSERLEQSDKLLMLAVTDLLDWVIQAETEYPDWKMDNLEMFLHSTTWEIKHNDNDRMHRGFGQLLDGVERAMLKHAGKDSECWNELGPKLLNSGELGLIYIALRACQATPDININLIESFIQRNQKMFFGCQLTEELWELVRISAPILTIGTLNNILTNTLELVDTAKDEDKPWILRHTYDLISRLPSCYLNPEAIQYISDSCQKLGPPSLHPRIYGGGGWVAPPVSRDDFRNLSPLTQLKLLKMIDRNWQSESHFGGDWHGMARVVSEVSSSDPVKYLNLLEILQQDIVEPEYPLAIIEGCSTYLRYKFGNLQPPNEWKAHSEPDAILLAQKILSYTTQIFKIDTDCARIIESCCTVLYTPDDAAKLIELINRLLSESPPEKHENDISHLALNTTTGEAVNSACRLYVCMSENGVQIPVELTDLLFKAANSSFFPARWALIRILPMMLQFDADLCWLLFQACHNDHPDCLWDVSEHFIYYTYWQHPDRYHSYLDRMAQHQKDEVRKSYGTLLALHYLSTKIEADDFWENVDTMDDDALSGTCRVFSHNVGNQDCGELCRSGLEKILGRQELPKKVKSEIEQVFSHKEQRLPKSLVLGFIFHIDEPEDRIFWLNDWLEQQSKYDPESVLLLLEALFKKLHQVERKNLWHAEGLVAATIAILRHADIIGDETLIRRAINIQDELILFHVEKMETALEEAARS